MKGRLYRYTAISASWDGILGACGACKRDQQPWTQEEEIWWQEAHSL